MLTNRRLDEQSARLILGVEPDADLAAVREAYRRASRLLHPDRLEGAPDELRAEATRRMSQLNQARAVLLEALPSLGGAPTGNPVASSPTPPRSRPAAQPDEPEQEHRAGSGKDGSPVTVLDCLRCALSQEVPDGQRVYACDRCRAPFFRLRCGHCRQITAVWGLGAYRCPHCGVRNSNPTVRVTGF